jgi:dolichol-phosphate mannosyltransferase
MPESRTNLASERLDLSVIIPANNEGPNLALLLPKLQAVLAELSIRYEILIVCRSVDGETSAAAKNSGATAFEQKERGYGGALLTAFTFARGEYFLTMDADLSHPAHFIKDLWRNRRDGDVTIASRYVEGGSAQMPKSRYYLSRALNTFFSRGLSLGVRDMSSGFRLYRAAAVRRLSIEARDFYILQELLVRIYAEGWSVQERPFDYAPRVHGSSNARIFKFGIAYIKTFWSLWKMRNSILCADYDDRAHDSAIFLQRYWQRSRYRYVTELIESQGAVLDVGCGSSRIIGALPKGSLAVDVLLRKLRYNRKFGRFVVNASGFQLPVRDGSFPCVLCSQVIEHVPKDSPILSELCRALAPGGLLVLGTPDYANWEWVFTEKLYGWFAPGAYADEHIAHYTRRELIDHFEKLGFQPEAVRYILRGELILALRKPREIVQNRVK